MNYFFYPILFLLSIFCCTCPGFSFAQNARTDSLEKLLTTLENDSNKVEMLNTLSVEFRSSNPEKSLHYAKEALTISQLLDYPKGQSASYNNMGVSYQEQGNYALAIDFHLKSLKIKEAMNDKKGMSRSYGNIGIINLRQNKLDEALEYFLKSLQLSEALGEKIVMASSYNNIGDIYRRKENYPLAMEYQVKSLQIRETLKDKRGMAASYNNIGILYHLQGNYLSSIKYQQFALKIQQELNDKRGMSISYINMAESHENLGQHDIAIDFYLKALKIAQEVSYKESLRNAYIGLSTSYKSKKDYQRAYEYLIMHSDIKDSLLNMESSSKIAVLQAQYEAEKKEKERELLVKAKEIEQKAELNKQKILRNSFIGGFAMVLILSFVLYRRYEDKKLANIQLEYQNIEINKQKEEIEQHRDQISRQKEKMTDSINYAKRIQQAILPPMAEIRKVFPESFIFYQPKDIVSGDFYWFSKIEQNGTSCCLIAAADCTGHGVPGAFMSMIGAELLNQIVIEKKTTEPSRVLTQLNDELRNALKQHEQDAESKDGMDISLCAIDLSNGKMHFAGAYRPLYLIRPAQAATTTDIPRFPPANSSLIEIKGDKFPVAGYHLAKERNYKNHLLEINKGDTFYMLSDGYTDQFGGPNKKTKFTTKQFKELLLSIQNKSMPEQEALLKSSLTEWQGSNSQIDDILVIGIRI